MMPTLLSITELSTSVTFPPVEFLRSIQSACNSSLLKTLCLHQFLPKSNTSFWGLSSTCVLMTRTCDGLLPATSYKTNGGDLSLPCWMIHPVVVMLMSIYLELQLSSVTFTSLIKCPLKLPSTSTNGRFRKAQRHFFQTDSIQSIINCCSSSHFLVLGHESHTANWLLAKASFWVSHGREVNFHSQYHSELRFS